MRLIQSIKIKKLVLTYKKVYFLFFQFFLLVSGFTCTDILFLSILTEKAAIQRNCSVANLIENTLQLIKISFEGIVIFYKSVIIIIIIIIIIVILSISHLRYNIYTGLTVWWGEETSKKPPGLLGEATLVVNMFVT